MINSQYSISKDYISAALSSPVRLEEVGGKVLSGIYKHFARSGWLKARQPFNHSAVSYFLLGASY